MVILRISRDGKVLFFKTFEFLERRFGSDVSGPWKPNLSLTRRHGCICPEQRTGAGVSSLSNPGVLDAYCPLHGEGAYEEHKPSRSTPS